MTRIAVIGASGNLGRALVGQALDRDMGVTALSRTITRSTPDARARAVDASDDDHETLVREFAGVDAVVLVFPPSLQHPEDYPEQVRRVFGAARDAGVPRLIGLVGSAGALTAHGIHLVDTDYFQETTRHFYQSVHAAWDVYRGETRPDWVTFVPAARMQVHLADRGTYRTRTDEQLVTTDDSSWRFFDVSQISYGDCARAMLDEIDRPAHSREFVTIGW
ncbi:MAG: NAD(P)H-binding protein [Microbacterium sp.]|uniref:NAD(P)-dependent oxidoreductase n=1 Tax=Microbacterium sp. TaxID=51671 RepID=UPI0039E2C179